MNVLTEKEKEYREFVIQCIHKIVSVCNDYLNIYSQFYQKCHVQSSYICFNDVIYNRLELYINDCPVYFRDIKTNYTQFDIDDLPCMMYVLKHYISNNKHLINPYEFTYLENVETTVYTKQKELILSSSSIEFIQVY